jgi:hypothetical protein
MSDDRYIEITTGEDYKRVVQADGVRTTVCANRFEIVAHPSGDINEQQAVQQLREWIRGRKEKELQGAGGVSG